MKTKIIVPIVALALSLSTTIFAQENDGRRDGKKDRKIPNREFTKHRAGMKAGIKADKASFFTEEQREAMKEIHLQALKESNPLKFKLQELKARQRTLMNEDKPNIRTINNNIDEITKIENQLAKIRAKARVEVLAKMTDEQRLKMGDFKKNKSGKKIKVKHKRQFHKS